METESDFSGCLGLQGVGVGSDRLVVLFDTQAYSLWLLHKANSFLQLASKRTDLLLSRKAPRAFVTSRREPRRALKSLFLVLFSRASP